MDSPVLSTIYCDDLRTEQSGKAIMIGCYGVAMYAKLPLTLHQFVAAHTLRIPIDFAQTEFRIDVKINGSVIASLSTDVEDAGLDMAEQDPYGLGDITHTVLNAAMFLTGLELSDPSIVTSEAIFGDQVIQGSKLRILPLPESVESKTTE